MASLQPDRLRAAGGLDRRRAAAGPALADRHRRAAAREPLRRRGPDARPARRGLLLRRLLLPLGVDRRSPAPGGCPACPSGPRPAASTSPPRPWTCAASPASPAGGCSLSQWYDDTRDYDLTCAPRTPSRRCRCRRPTLSGSTADFNGDWKNDVLARVTATADLRLYAGTGRGTLPRRPHRHRLARLRRARDPRRLQRRRPRSTSSPGSGPPATCGSTPATARGGWLPRVRVGTGWNIFNAIVGPGDLNGDQRVGRPGPRAVHRLPLALPRQRPRRLAAPRPRRHRLEHLQRHRGPRGPQRRRQPPTSSPASPRTATCGSTPATAAAAGSPASGSAPAGTA